MTKLYHKPYQTEAQRRKAEYMQRWRAAHPEYTEGLKSYLRDYYQKNKSAMNAAGSDYYQRNYKKCSTNHKQYRAQNKSSIREWEKQYRAGNAAIIQAAKDRPCVDCDIQYVPHRMHFDHVRGIKRFNLGHRASKMFSRETILAEIAKCEVRCARCHARRHHPEKP